MIRLIAPLAFAAWPLAATFAVDPPAANAWRYEEQSHGRRVAHVECQAKGSKGPLAATYLVTRSTGAARRPITKDGVTTPPLVVELCIHDAKAAAPFPIDEFEGPDAPASRSKLVNVRMTSAEKEWARDFVASGWYSNLSVVLNPAVGSDSKKVASEPAAFVFGLGDAIRNHRELLEMADKLAAGASAMTIQIKPPGGKGSALEFEIPTSGAGAALRKLLGER